MILKYKIQMKTILNPTNSTLANIGRILTYYYPYNSNVLHLKTFCYINLLILLTHYMRKIEKNTCTLQKDVYRKLILTYEFTL